MKILFIYQGHPPLWARRVMSARYALINQYEDGLKERQIKAFEK
jgi:hypothetical protein